MDSKRSVEIVSLVMAGAAVLFIIFALAKGGAPTKVKLITTASYSCDGGKTIEAAYYQGESKPSPGPDLPPLPAGSVSLVLSDGRSLTLPQTVSADGARYANAGESFIFWSKGNGALVLEGGRPKAYTGCILLAPAQAGDNLVQAYSNSAYNFSLRLPAGYTADAAYKYQALGPGKDIDGVKFTISAALAAGTNLASDSYISFEEIPGAADCSASLFTYDKSPGKAVTDGDVDYSVAQTNDAGAGNRYDETVYAIPGTDPCVAVRYFIHYAAFENYPPGAVRHFDEPALVSAFDAIRRTLIVNQ